MPEELKDRLEFSYESIGASSYLIIKTGPSEEILDYQVSMTGCNSIARLLKYDLKGINGSAYCYYNITSKLALSFFLKRRQLTRNEFVKLLSDIASTIVDSAGYLLSDSSCLLDSDYIFINPEDLEIAMVYIPVNMAGDTCKAFKDLMLKLILQLADIEEKVSDNFLQRILAFVRNDMFNFSDFLKMLDSMLYGDEASEAEGCGKFETPVAAKLEQNSINEEKKTGSMSKKPVAIVLLSQIAIAAVVLFVMKYVKLPGGNSFVNCLALILIVIAMDMIIIKNVLKGVKLNINAGAREEPAENGRTDIFANNGDMKIPEEKPEPKIKPAISNNTVLLGSIKTEFPILKSRSNPGLEDIVISKQDFIVGRLKEQADFISKNGAVGKIHAQIIKRNDLWHLKDLNSVNGTFVNNSRIASNVEYILEDGDIVAFANCEYVFEEGFT